jgi:hypothetical protein
MKAALIELVETGIERGASAVFAAAVGYSAYLFVGTTALDPQLAYVAAGAGVLAYLPCCRLIRMADGSRAPTPLPEFPAGHFDFAETQELLLTETLPAEELLLTDRVEPDELVLTESDRPGGNAPLVLDDILAEIGPDARVVRLFDRRAMPAPGPTPGQLQTRIAEYMKDGTPAAPSDLAGPSDASQALSAALAELRRSLR